MKQKASMVALKLLNLYRQEHVIFGGWAAVNPIFVSDATPEVIDALREMPTGKMLVRHIENLRTGKTAMDTIDRELLPYGGLMAETTPTISLTRDEWTELERGINEFTPDQDGLHKLGQLPVVQKFGEQWLVAIRAALATRPDLLDKWAIVSHTYRAYQLWNIANDILTQPLSDRTRAQLQADMPEYETYLPMFGTQGDDLLAKLRAFISTMKPRDDTDTQSTGNDI